jgi:hypothetical protein
VDVVATAWYRRSLVTRKRMLPDAELAAASWIISASGSMPRPRPKKLAS